MEGYGTLRYPEDTHRYNNANEAIRQFGYYTVREWKIIDNALKITIRTQF